MAGSTTVPPMIEPKIVMLPILLRLWMFPVWSSVPPLIPALSLRCGKPEMPPCCRSVEWAGAPALTGAGIFATGAGAAEVPATPLHAADAASMPAQARRAIRVRVSFFMPG